MKIKFLAIIALASCCFMSCSDDDKSDNHSTEQTDITKPDDPGKPDDLSPKPEERWSDINNTYLFGSLSDDVKAVLPVVPGTSIDNIGMLYANDIVMNSTHAFIVDSGNNTIHRVSLDSLEVEKNYIDLGQDIGPYTAYVDDKELYIVCNLTSQVVKVDLSTKQQTVVLNADHLVSGTAVTKVGNTVIVADSEYNFEDSAKTEGKLVVIKEDGSIIEHKTATPNPTFIQSVKLDGKDFIVSSNSGVIQYDENWQPKAPEQSCVQLWALDDLVKNEDPAVKTHCEQNSSVGRLFVSDSHLYVGDGVTPKVYMTGITQLADFDTWTNMTFGDAGSLGMTIPVTVEDDLAVFNFNQDSMTWVRGEHRLTLKLSPSEASKKGPISVVYDASHRRIYVLNSSSGSLDLLNVK